jgi:hypothetical protein
MPAQAKRRSRKRRTSGAAGGTRGTRPEQPLARAGAAPREKSPSARGSMATTLTGRTYGDPPSNPFGGVPVSEIAIAAGAVAVVVGLAATAPVALVVGVIVCTLAVAEFSAREHFSGYRSHATMLAGIPAVAVGVLLIVLLGGSLHRTTLLVVVIPVFGVLFVLLRKRFRTARQARVVRPPSP